MNDEDWKYNQQAIKDILLVNIDTYKDMLTDDYLNVVRKNNFKEILSETFFDGNGKPNNFFVFWHPKGLLLAFDTITWSVIESVINSAYLYYNIEMTAPFKDYIKKVSNGSLYWDGPITADDRNLTNIWVGYKDVRGGLMSHMYEINSVGRHLTEWVDSKQVMLSHYMDDWRLDHNRNITEKCRALYDATKRRLSLMGETGKMLLKVHRNE